VDSSITCLFAASPGHVCPDFAGCATCRSLYTPEQVARELQADIKNAAVMRQWLADHQEPECAGG